MSGVQIPSVTPTNIDRLGRAIPCPVGSIAIPCASSSTRQSNGLLIRRLWVQLPRGAPNKLITRGDRPLAGWRCRTGRVRIQAPREIIPPLLDDLRLFLAPPWPLDHARATADRRRVL